MDKIMNIISNIIDWFTTSWTDTFGDTGVQIISGVIGLMVIAGAGVICVGLFKKVISR